MKRKLTMTLALVAALMMTASVAVAAVVLNYSPAASALKQARNALVEKYGLTHTTLGLFTYSMLLMDSETVIVFHSYVVDEYGKNLAGEYTVTIPENGEVIAAWTYDNVDPIVWQSGDINAPVWGQPQLEAFLRDKTEGGTANYTASLDDGGVTYTVAGVTPSPVPVGEEDVITITIAEVTPGPDDLSKADAIELARAALMDTFGLTEAEISQADFFSCTLQQWGDYEPRTWQINAWLKQDGCDWNMYVSIDASTGEITDIDMQTGGNG